MARYNSLEHTVEVRQCPKCNTRWEKAYGCNHMSCTCGTAFCWGCGGEHTGSHAFCGRITVPLERVNIVPLPTEKFPLAMIEIFQQFLAFKVKPFSLQETEKVVVRFLVKHDRNAYLSYLLGQATKTTTEEQEATIRNAVKVFNASCEMFPHATLCWPLSRTSRTILRGGLATLVYMREVMTKARATGGWLRVVESKVRELQRVQRVTKRVCK